MQIFGSTLLKKIFPDFREPNDIDWVTNDPAEMKASRPGEEYYCIDFFPNRELTADEMYTVKTSHAIYDIHWKKTMSDIRFLQMKGCKIVPELMEKLRTHWETVHGKQHRTDFEVMPGKFFEDRVRRKVDHDEMHKMINPTPTYTKMVPPGEVSPSPEMFWSMTDLERREAIYEEAFVIAIERHSHLPDKAAYSAAQRDLITRLHPVWLADFVIEGWSRDFWMPTKSTYYEIYAKTKNNI